MTEAELQTEETGEEVSAETATAEQPEQEKTPEGYIKADESQRQVNKQHRKYRDEERARKRVEAEAEQLRKELEDIKAKQEAVEVPPVPDPYSDDFAQKLEERERAISRKAEQDARPSARKKTPRLRKTKHCGKRSQALTLAWSIWV